MFVLSSFTLKLKNFVPEKGLHKLQKKKFFKTTSSPMFSLSHFPALNAAADGGSFHKAPFVLLWILRRNRLFMRTLFSSCQWTGRAPGSAWVLYASTSNEMDNHSRHWGFHLQGPLAFGLHKPGPFFFFFGLMSSERNSWAKPKSYLLVCSQFYSVTAHIDDPNSK